MKQLTKKEQQLVRKLVDLKQTARLEELQAARLLRKELECFALKWTLKPQYTLSFYSSNYKDWDKLKKSYFQVADFLYFIEELEQENLIKIQTLSFDLKADEERVLYDRHKYEYHTEDDTFCEKDGNGLFRADIKGKQIVYIDIVKYLEKYANKIIYPLPLLEDFVENKYKSIEQRNFEKQISKTNCALWVSIIALVVSTIISIIEIRCSPPTKIDNHQLKIIEQSIIKKKATYPSFRQLSDTLKNVSPNKKINKLYDKTTSQHKLVRLYQKWSKGNEFTISTV